MGGTWPCCHGVLRVPEVTRCRAAARNTGDWPIEPGVAADAGQPYQVATSCSDRSPLQTSGRSRRDALLAGAALSAAATCAASFSPWPALFPGRHLALASAAADEPPQAVRVELTAGAEFSSISAALDAVSAGTVINIAPGTYRERLRISKPVTLQRAPESQGGDVSVIWETSEPYQAVLEAGPDAAGALVRGLTLRHESPSVANNYAVFLPGCDISLEDCDISSSSGSGVGIEGGNPRLIRCAVHDCERHGVAIFGDALGGGDDAGGAGALVEGCTLSRNKLNGLLIRDGAAPQVLSSTVSENGAFGIVLQDCAGEIRSNVVSGNRKGSVAISDLAQADSAELALQNQLDKVPSSMKYR